MAAAFSERRDAAAIFSASTVILPSIPDNLCGDILKAKYEISMRPGSCGYDGAADYRLR